ncbi:MAG: CinA family protein, partial [Clostridia bacterium]|nr:CinA family protein [Clostridia bacterium]
MKVEFKENFTPTLVNSANVELIGILKSKGLTISIAESFTGGNISAKLTA